MIPAIWVQMEQEQQANEQEFASEDVNHTTLMTEFNFYKSFYWNDNMCYACSHSHTIFKYTAINRCSSQLGGEELFHKQHMVICIQGLSF